MTAADMWIDEQEREVEAFVDFAKGRPIPVRRGTATKWVTIVDYTGTPKRKEVLVHWPGVGNRAVPLLTGRLGGYAVPDEVLEELRRAWRFCIGARRNLRRKTLRGAS